MHCSQVLEIMALFRYPHVYGLVTACTSQSSVPQSIPCAVIVKVNTEEQSTKKCDGNCGSYLLLSMKKMQVTNYGSINDVGRSIGIYSIITVICIHSHEGEQDMLGSQPMQSNWHHVWTEWVFNFVTPIWVTNHEKYQLYSTGMLFGGSTAFTYLKATCTHCDVQFNCVHYKSICAQNLICSTDHG